MGALPNSVPIFERETMRSAVELEPLLRQVAENVCLMKKLHATVGCGDKARVHAMIDEVRNYARSIDPKLTHAEGTTVFLFLTAHR